MKNYIILNGYWLAIVVLCAFVAPMAKRKVMADKAASTVSYAAKHPLHNWEGVSHDVNCAMIYNDESKQPESIAVSIKVASFDSDNNNRDSHAVEAMEGIKYPNVTFTSSDIKSDNGALTAKGTLTFHGVARPVTLQATSKEAGGKMTLIGEFPVNMTDYKIERPSLMGMKTEDAMILRFNVVFSL
ncbi:YceI family protein [Spirosoma endophyticum]|uniref:Polyisoprenoid-binding protein YceI n=1 Tax=Spirosoma endophyticum TaxID=662367 RepID=A0A1I1T668_9BACT|nr:YceI family protein [Spirosoma endophyticum]SFD54082.1 Polyisoprenoid-binding protein YceI [Spirosoma endophyticum]